MLQCEKNGVRTTFVPPSCRQTRLTGWREDGGKKDVRCAEMMLGTLLADLDPTSEISARLCRHRKGRRRLTKQGQPRGSFQLKLQATRVALLPERVVLDS